MYIAPCDRDVLWSEEMRRLKEQYREKHGEGYPHFNYRDFKRSGDKCAAEVYLEALKKALQ